jgi:chorismate synthase
VDAKGKVVSISVRGRHDPCIVPRIVPVAEAMLALVLVDALLEQEKYTSYREDLKTRMKK